MRVLNRFLIVVIACAIGLPAAAQTVSNATVVVVVTDQTGGVLPGAMVTMTNSATRASRELPSGKDGSATFPALPLTGTYQLTVRLSGFADGVIKDIALRSAETATFRVKLQVAGKASEVTVYGTTSGVRADSQIGKRLDSERIDETPILGRKLSTLPLFNSAFRQAKGTGDLFVNQTYFVTGGGSRRTTTYVLDGASNDDGWGRQTMIATVPVSAVQEVSVLANAFSAEFGWTAGPAMNVVTKSGTNALHGEGLYMSRPGRLQATSFSIDGFCPPSISTCTTPSALTSISPVDIPDTLHQVSGSIGGAVAKDRTFFFAAGDITRQDRTTALSSTLPAFVLDSGSLEYVGHYRQTLGNGRIDHRLNANQTVMFRFNADRMYDTNPNDTVIGTTAPSAARKYTRQNYAAQVNHTAVLGANLVNEARFGFTDGDPVTKWEAVQSGTIYQRTAGPVPFRIGANQVSDLYSRQAQFSDTLSWSTGKHYVRIGGSLARHMTGGVGNEPGQALLGTFTFNGTGANGSLPFSQLTLADVQTYSQPYSFGAPPSYALNQWLGQAFIQDKVRVRTDLTLDLGVRYDVQTLTDARKNVAPRIGFGWHPNGDARLAIRGGYGMYYTQVISNLVAGYVQNGLDGFTTYTATPGQPGFPTCLTGSCLPVTFSSSPAAAPARNITIVAGKRDFYLNQFAEYGLNFSLLPGYTNTLVNPRSQVASIGAEKEIVKGVFVGGDYVHQHWTNLVRTADLNAPTVFDRTAPGQTRTVPAANATRPILPVTGGVTSVNTIMNLGVADYDGLQTEVSYRGSRVYTAVSYTWSKATNTSEPDGNGIGPNQNHLSRLGEDERGPSLLDQRHRAVITFSCQLPYNLTVGTVTQLASARPINATTGVDNNGDGATNDRPVINGAVVSRSAFRGTGTQDVAMFVEGRLKGRGRALLLRLEVFNLFNHANLLGRGVTTYGDDPTPASTFGQFAGGTTTTAIPAFANIDPPRMVQIQIRYTF